MARKRRSFPINLTEDYSSRDVQEAVLLDLVHKFPRGPRGNLVKDDYRQYYTDPQLRAADDSICGYRKVDLFRMVRSMKEGFNVRHGTNEWDYRDIIHVMWPDVGPRGITRRSRRLADRIGRAVRQVQSSGLPGIWNVSWGYNDMQKAVVAANSSQDAINQAKIFFGPFITDEYRLSAQFEREGSKLELMNSNQPLINAIGARQQRLQSRIKDLQEEIESFDCLKSLVEVYSISCLEA